MSDKPARQTRNRVTLFVLACVSIAMYWYVPGLLGLILNFAMYWWLGVVINALVRRYPRHVVVGHILVLLGLGVSSAALLLGEHQYLLTGVLALAFSTTAFNPARWRRHRATFAYEGETIRCCVCRSVEVEAAGSTEWPDPLTMPFGGPTTKRPVFKCSHCGNVGTVNAESPSRQ